MPHPLLLAAALVAATVTIHASGFALIAGAFSHTPPVERWRIIWKLVRVAWVLILLHVLEISLWGLFFWWQGCLPDLESALYFSGVTYTTVGYGDLVLATHWRLLGPIEGLVGILMCGLSAAMFFALLGRIYASKRNPIDH
jgi:hypothetical protein